MERFAQEYEGEFQGSSGTLISGAVLKRLSYTKPIHNSEGLLEYEPPQPGRAYMLIADVARGKGLDYSAFSVIDVTEMPYRQACTFRDNKIGPSDYASVIYRVASAYNQAHVLVEINDIGGQVSDELFELGYENILYSESSGRSGKSLSSGFSSKAKDRGIRTTKTVKSVGCAVIKRIIERDQLLIRDEQTVFELNRFSKKGDSYEAEPKCHDDTVMPLVLFGWLTDQTYFKELTEIDTMRELRERSEEQIEEQMLPFGFRDDGSAQSEDVTLQVEDWGVMSSW